MKNAEDAQIMADASCPSTGDSGQRIADIQPNQDVAGTFVVEEKQLRTTKNGKPFLSLKLRDKTGSVTARLWENATKAAQTLAGHKVLRIQGRSQEYQNEIQIHIQHMEPVPRDAVDPSDFLPVCPKDPHALWKALKGLLQKVHKKPYGELIRAFVSDKALMAAFCKAPAAKNVHHAYVGGLLEHTVGVMHLCALIGTQYPSLDQDLLLMGAFLHDMGKVHEFTYDLVIDYSDVGRLVGHMVLGVEILNAKIAMCKDFPEETAVLLKHLILSHHGEPQFGAVQSPMTREAFALHLADDLDAKMNSLDDILAKNDDPDSLWTAYQSLYGRYFYKGPRQDGPSSDAPDPEPPSAPCREVRQLPLWPGVTEKGRAHDDA